MVDVSIGNLLESGAQTLVNTVNCVGVMGKGIALDFKRRFPEMYKDYVERCARGEVRLGRPYLFRSMFAPWVLNFPTKKDWRSVSRQADIETGLDYLEAHYCEWGISSLAMPPLGCGNGGLEWAAIGPLLYQRLKRLDIPVELYAPHGTPREQLESAFLDRQAQSVARGVPHSAKMNPAWVALVEILARIEREPYHWSIGRTTFQKIAYFATQEGLPTGFHYARASYGPYSADQKGAVIRLVNNNLLQEQERGKMFMVKPGSSFPRAARAMESLLNSWEPIIERVTDLFLRISTTRQAEMAATVAFATRELETARSTKPSEMDVLQAVREWKRNRKPQPTDDEVASAIRSLTALYWLNVEPSPDLPVSDEILLHA